MIDGRDAVDAWYYYAGVTGIYDVTVSLADIWKMGVARARSLREHAVSQAMLVWSLAETDIDLFLRTGAMVVNQKEEKVRMDPDLARKVAEHHRRMKDAGGVFVIPPEENDDGSS